MNQNKGFKVLVVDDEEGMRFNLEKVLGLEGYSVRSATTGVAALELLSSQAFDLAFVDLQLPDFRGTELISRMDLRSTSVVVVTAYATVATAVEAMKLGASDYLQKPFDLQDVLDIAHRCYDGRNADAAGAHTATAFDGPGQIAGSPRPMPVRDTPHVPPKASFFAVSPAMRDVLSRVDKVRNSDIPVLLLGESGTGKEMVARLIHETSARQAKPFVGLNCAAIPRELLESELFGYEKGAFTGAAARKTGKFEAAADGTIFLDEIGDMDFALQTKLLRALEERSFEAVGSNRGIELRARVIASTNRNLPEMLATKEFRPDLYYRLKGLSIKLPPLRERKEDLEPLIRHYLARYRDLYAKPQLAIAHEALRVLKAYAWPGNIRELKNAMESAVLLSDGIHPLLPKDFSLEGTAEENDEGSEFFRDVSSAERETILDALKENGFNRSLAAKQLGVSRKTLYNKLKKYTLD